MRDNPETIFKGTNPSGKAAEIVFRNLTCLAYEDKEAITAKLIRAMESLGGRRFEDY